MAGRVTYGVVMFLLLRGVVIAQVSPGELSGAHAHLEGLGHCTSCHDLGKAVSNDKCLQCHLGIKSRMERRSGLHALYAGRQCVECHKEHHGRNFPVVKFDVATFDHASAGFTLQGAHARLSCRQCHKRENIRSEDVLANAAALEQGTYLGLSGACASCHADVHKGQLAMECARCHTAESWTPAGKFDHGTARFRLTGMHRTIECSACHRRDNGGIARFAGLQFSSCASCHRDPHDGRFNKQRCEDCHTTRGWTQVAAGHFDHASTRFPLRGRHASVKCAQCHGAKKKVPAGTRTIAQFSRCADCHGDPHGGQFRGQPDAGACESCHSVNGFAPSTFTSDQHYRTRFPLSGGHLAVPCRSCHLPESRKGGKGWVFRVEGPERCEVCHRDPHQKQFSSAVPKGCPACHSSDNWRNVRFSHEQTRFPLRGKHIGVACARCHAVTGVVAEGKGIPVVDTTLTHPDAPARLLRWKGNVSCATCHPDVHRGQFAQKFDSRCEPCHTTLAWNVLNFTHESTAFPLTGKHVDVPCVKCHLLIDEGTEGEGRIYSGTPRRCEECHRAGKQTSKSASGGER